VPFGRRRVVGVLLEITATTDVPASKLRSALEVLDSEPAFDPVLFELLTWSADYYRHPIGEVLMAALPMALRQGAPLDERTERWGLTEAGVREWASLPARSTRLRALAEALSRGAEANELAGVSSTWRAGLRELAERGWVERETVATQAPRMTPRVNASEHALSEAQRVAVAKILSAIIGQRPLPNPPPPAQGRGTEHSRFRTFLLHGVTGSGKTEVYLRAIVGVGA
jgi:primosomal protein N' (replication factor Y)